MHRSARFFSPLLRTTQARFVQRTARRGANDGIGWRARFGEVETVSQLTTVLERLFHKHPSPHHHIVVHALAAFTRLAVSSSRKPGGRRRGAGGVDGNKLDVILMGLQTPSSSPSSPSSSIDLAQLALTKLISRLPPRTLTPAVHQSYVHLLSLTSRSADIPFNYLVALSKDSHTYAMSRSLLLACARHKDAGLAHRIIDLAYAHAQDERSPAVWLALGVHLAIAAQVGKAAALAAVAWLGSESIEAAGVVGAVVCVVVGARMAGVWVLQDMVREESEEKDGRLWRIIVPRKPEAVRKEMYDYFMTAVKEEGGDEEDLEMIRREMRAKGVQ